MLAPVRMRLPGFTTTIITGVEIPIYILEPVQPLPRDLLSMKVKMLTVEPIRHGNFLPIAEDHVISSEMPLGLFDVPHQAAVAPVRVAAPVLRIHFPLNVAERIACRRCRRRRVGAQQSRDCHEGRCASRRLEKITSSHFCPLRPLSRRRSILVRSFSAHGCGGRQCGGGQQRSSSARAVAA
jgi:hypothetical protein